MQTSKDFSEVFYASVVEGLQNTLGESPMKATLYMLDFSMSSADPHEFTGKLRSVFGAGSMVLEKIVVKELYSRLGLPFLDSSTFDFEAYVKRARHGFASSPRGIGFR